MLVLFVIGAALIAIAGVNYLLGRREIDTTLQRHERALEALRDLAEHPAPPGPVVHPPETLDNVRIVAVPPEEVLRARRARARRRTAAARRHPAGARSKAKTSAAMAARPTIDLRAFDRPATTEPIAVSTSPAETAPEPEPRRIPRPPARHSGRALLATAAALVVIALAATAALANGGSHPRDRRATPPSTDAAPAPVVATAPAAPPSTVAAATPIQLVAAPNGTGGTVTVAAPFTVTLQPDAPCWVSVRTDAGQVLFEGTLGAGQQQQITAPGPVVIRLGNAPAMQLRVNGTPLTLSGVGQTTNVHFVSPV